VNITVLFMVGAGDANVGRRGHWGEFGLTIPDGKMRRTQIGMPGCGSD